jgi:hypothetical protein
MQIGELSRELEQDSGPPKENGDTNVANSKTEFWQKPGLIFERPNVKNNLQASAIAIVRRLIEFCAKLQICKNAQDQSKAAAEHATHFEPPVYNIWKQQSKNRAPARNC